MINLIVFILCDIMEKNNSKIVLVYPSPLIITKQRNSNFYESQLNLTNLTNEYVIFKLYNKLFN